MAPQKKGPRGTRKYTPALVRAKKRVKELEGEVVELQADVRSTLEAKNAGLNQIEELQGEKVNLLSQLSEQVCDLSTARIRIVLLDESNTTLALRAMKAESELSEKRDMVARLTSDITTLHDDLRAMEHRCALHEARIRELQEELDGRNEDVIMLVSDVRSLREDLEDITKR